MGPPLSAINRIRSVGVIVDPAAFISARFVSGALTEGYSPTRDHISDLAAAVGRPHVDGGLPVAPRSRRCHALPMRLTR